LTIYGGGLFNFIASWLTILCIVEFFQAVYVDVTLLQMKVMIMKFRNSILMLGFALAVTAPVIATAPAQAQSSASADSFQNQAFFKKKYSIKGTWTLVKRDDKTTIRFSDDFKTKNGPDLKVFLSPKSAAEVNGKNAVEGAIQLGVLKNNKGAQVYEIPAGTDLSQFSTLLVHCEAYSVLWGGGSL